MTIKDDTKGIKIEIETSLSTTKYEVASYELAAIIGQFMGCNDMTNERFFEMFFSDVK